MCLLCCAEQAGLRLWCRCRQPVATFNARQPKVGNTEVWHRKAALIHPRGHINAESNLTKFKSAFPAGEGNACSYVSALPLPVFCAFGSTAFCCVFCILSCCDLHSIADPSQCCKLYLMYIFKELLLLLVIKGVGMRYVTQCILRLQGRKHNLIFCLQHRVTRLDPT